MNPKANAVLLTALSTIKSKVKPKTLCDSHTKPKPKPDDGKAEWVRFKTECVLLKGGKSR